IGYALTGVATEEVIFILYGFGQNGKTTLMETVRSLLADYALAADFSTFLTKQHDGPRNDLARLAGARFVSASETAAGRRLAEAFIKQVTGRDTVSARFLFGEFVDFKPRFKVFLATNHKPIIEGTDNGIWRRIHLVPFEVTIPDDERDKDLSAKLLAE